jgi:hypothetical protein
MITTTERFEGDGLTVLVTFRPTEVQMIWQGVSAATVSPILQFVKSLDVESQAITLVYDTNVFWQRAQYRCMRAIAFQLKHVKVADTV